MWQNVKYYVLAYAIMVAGALLSSGFQLLGDQFPVGHPASTIAANLSGVTIGGLIMVIGFLKDSRLDEERQRTEAERKRTEAERQRAADAEARAAEAEFRAERERERAERERERSDRMLERYEAATAALIQRLEERNGAGGSQTGGLDSE